MLIDSRLFVRAGRRSIAARSFVYNKELFRFLLKRIRICDQGEPDYLLLNNSLYSTIND